MNEQRDCLLHVVDLNSASMMHGFALQKGLQWKDVISRKFLKYSQDGTISKIDKKWLSGSCHESQAKSHTHQKYTIAHFSYSFLVVTVTMAAMVLATICWILIVKCKEMATRVLFNRNRVSRHSIAKNETRQDEQTIEQNED